MISLNLRHMTSLEYQFVSTVKAPNTVKYIYNEIIQSKLLKTGHI